MVDLELPQDKAAPARARAQVDELGLDPERGQELKLVVSELVTNALLHGEGPISLRLREADGTVEGEVADAGEGFPSGVPETTDPDDAEGGRGLYLVDTLCRRWSVDSRRSRVRFEFASTA
jgi:anti-sigma regulatory factor (Ser/Thr protein kinase)